MLGVRSKNKEIIYFLLKLYFDKVVKLVAGGSVINKATLSNFYLTLAKPGAALQTPFSLIN